MAANAAILYHPDGYQTSGPKLMGRQAAGEGFLAGFARHADVGTYYCLSTARDIAERFAASVMREAPAGRQVAWIAADAPARIAEPGCLYLPGPGLSEYAFQRRAVGQRAYSLCGVTHTTASAGAMDAIASLLTGPVQPWDALICTSGAVLDTVRQLLESQAAYLSERLGAARFTVPQLPVIPLGVDCGAFAGGDAHRAAWRGWLGIAADDVAVLFMGRLSFHAKANPIPMFQALEKAAAGSGRRVHLIQAGWFANAFIENAFKAEAAAWAPSIVHHWLDGRQDEVRRQVWAAADIFTSLSDNVQETFGLTPIEAMAAGLPVVVSDWDGYKDTVRDGVDGFRVPTWMPPAGLGTDLAFRHETGADSYDVYCGMASQFVAVDVDACAEAYGRLIGDAELRRRMGAAGAARAREAFDWSVIVARYQELWAGLAELRRSAAESAPVAAGRPANPGRQDPYRLFAGYPTTVLGGDHGVDVREGAGTQELASLLDSPMVKYCAAVLPSGEEFAALLKAARDPGARAGTIVSAFPEAHRGRLFRGLLWLAKYGLVRLRR